MGILTFCVIWSFSIGLISITESSIDQTYSEIIGNMSEDVINDQLEGLIDKFQGKIEMDSTADQFKPLIDIETKRTKSIMLPLWSKFQKDTEDKKNELMKKSERSVIHKLTNQIIEYEKDVLNGLKEQTKNMELTVNQSISSARENLKTMVLAIFGNASTQKSAARNIVAFSSILVRNLKPDNKFVVFDKIITNIGNSYNSSNGVFIAPYRGNYLFTSSFLVADGYVNVQLMKNDSVISRGYATENNHEAMGLISASLYLSENDQIGIKVCLNHSTGILRGDLYSSFSGFLRN